MIMVLPFGLKPSDQIHLHVAGCNVEVLTLISKVINHHCLKYSIQRLKYLVIILNVLKESVNKSGVKQIGIEAWMYLGLSVKNLRTKTGMMVGLGERFDEVITTMKQAVEIGVKIFTIGQYLQPTKNHLPVKRYVEDKEFQDYKLFGLEAGFDVVKSGSLVRSSYHADEFI